MKDFIDFITLLGYLALDCLLIMLCWNWLMPFLFGLPTITFWQTFGLKVLTKALFRKQYNDPDRANRQR